MATIIIIIFLGSFLGFLFVLTTATKKYNAEEEKKLAIQCRDHQAGLMREIVHAPSTSRLDESEGKVVRFTQKYLGRVDYRLIAHLSGELHAAIANRRGQIVGLQKRLELHIRSN